MKLHSGTAIGRGVVIGAACCLAASSLGAPPRLGDAQPVTVRTPPLTIGIHSPGWSGSGACCAWCVNSRRGWHGWPPFTRDIRYFTPGWHSVVAAPYWRRYTQWRPPLQETTRRVAPGAAAAAPAPLPAPSPSEAQPSQTDLAVRAMQAREYGRAAAIFGRLAQERLSAEASAERPPPADRGAQRLHALALAASGDMAGAQRALAEAYAADPLLRERPVDGAALFASASELRGVLRRAVTHAHAVGSGEAWELVATIMDAESRPDAARRIRVRHSGSEPARAGGAGQGEGERAAPPGECGTPPVASFRMPPSEEEGDED